MLQLSDINTFQPMNKNMAVDDSFSIIVMGESGVGKTYLQYTFVKGQNPEEFLSPSIGIDYSFKICNLTNSVGQDSFKVKLQIWDTSGQEKFRSVGTIMIKKCCGAILVFDLTRKSSFDNAKTYWLPHIVQNSDNIPVVLIGNKCDLDRQISQEQIQQFAKNNNLEYFETTVHNYQSVFQAFSSLIEKIADSRRFGECKSEMHEVEQSKLEQPNSVKNEKQILDVQLNTENTNRPISIFNKSKDQTKEKNNCCI